MCVLAFMTDGGLIKEEKVKYIVSRVTYNKGFNLYSTHYTGNHMQKKQHTLHMQKKQHTLHFHFPISCPIIKGNYKCIYPTHHE